MDDAAISALGLGGAPTAALAGGTPEENAALVEAVLAGSPGPHRDVVLLNAAAAFVAAGRAADLGDRDRARDRIDRRRQGDGPPRPAALGTGRGRGREDRGGPGAGQPGMTVATRRPATVRPARGSARGVVEEIAARRLADLEPELARSTPAELRASRGRGPAPATVRRAPRPARPPPHRRGQAQLAVGRRDRRSPATIRSPGLGPTSVAARPRSASSASRTGSVARWRTWRRSGRRCPSRSSPRSSSSTRASSRSSGRPGRTRSCSSRCSIRRAGSPRLVDAALDLGLEPLVEAHDARELDRALATRARLIGVNNRDLRTLDVDPERAVRLRADVPDDRLGDRRVGRPRARDGRRLAGGRLRRRARRRGAHAGVRSGRGRPVVRLRRGLPRSIPRSPTGSPS